jgi:hypothetical protein
MQRILFGLVAAVLRPLCLSADRRPNEDRGRVYMREIRKNCHTPEPWMERSPC